MKRALGFLLVTVWTCAADGPYIPDGKLGFPLGTYLTVEGERVKGDGMKGGTARVLMVDTVNGKKLEKPTATIVETRGALPAEGRIVVRGYETGKMIGVPFEVARQEKLSLPQAGWQFFRSFIITSWVTPKGPVQARMAPRSPPPPPPSVGVPATAQSSKRELEERLKRIRERREQMQRDAEKARAAAEAAKKE